MSAPDTNIEKQKERHRPSLAGMAIAAAFGVAMIAVLVVIVSARGEAPEGAETQIDGRTGAVEAPE